MSLVGRHIGRYRILEQLGQGGMSIVYKGIDTTLDREVAVKVLHPHLSGRLESRKRLEREAKAVARLHHPNILEVFDYSGETATEAFLVTEYIRGQTLREFITQEALSPPEIAAMVVYELASALAHAHEAGILHRDLKPENVMVRDDGVLKLMDFGIAKILDRDEKMTMTGALVGSPAHMAPEIIEGEDAGAPADVFSLGTMLYLFATGKLPFAAPNTTATLKRILDCVYDDPRKVNPTVSDALADIIGLCLQRQPAHRYESAVKLKEALAEYLTGLGLERPHEELASFFLSPRSYRKELLVRVTQALLGQAERSIALKKSARAMSALNQVLAHEPSNVKANELLGQMRASRQREARLQKLKRLAWVGSAACLALIAAVQGFRVVLAPLPFKAELTLAPTDVALSGVIWPKSESAKTQPEEMVMPATTPSEERVVPKAVKSPLLIEVALIVRPFGYVQVDDGPRSADALARHVLKLTPGNHRFTVTCDLCEAHGRTVTVAVQPDDEIPLIAPLKPSLVSFQGWPDDAVVRVGGVEKTTKESLALPFKLSTPPAGSAEMRHRVEYSITVSGEVVDKGVQFALPGKALLIERQKSL